MKQFIRVQRFKFLGAAVSAALALTLVVMFGGQQAQAQQMVRDCSTNSIIRCGSSSPADLVAKIRANDPNDLQAIYNQFRLTSDRYDAFARDAKMGMAHRDGTIVVDGQVVARNAWSIGREAKPYSTAYRIGGTTYHRSKSTDVLKQDLPVMVWFDDRGQVAAAVLAACGNPMGGDIVRPQYRCNQLRRESVSGQPNTYRFSTDAPASAGATVSRVVYDFGDGSAKVTRTNPADTVTHTYEDSGNYTARVTVYVRLADGREVAVNGSGCAQRVTVRQQDTADWRCDTLQATRRDGDDDFAYTFRANTTQNNARLVRADFDFGDGTTNSVQAAGSSSNSISANHTYASAGTYTVRATVYFEADDNANANGSATSVTCQTEVTVDEPEATVTPAAAATPPPAEELPRAGAAGAAGLFAGASLLGAAGYRWRAKRRMSRIDQVIDGLRQK